MYYLTATRHNGILVLNVVQGFNDDSLVYEEPMFLEELKDLDDDELIEGIVSSDIYDVLNNAYDIA